MIRRPPISTPLYSSAASDVYKRQHLHRRLDATKWRVGLFLSDQAVRNPVDRSQGAPAGTLPAAAETAQPPAVSRVVRAMSIARGVDGLGRPVGSGSSFLSRGRAGQLRVTLGFGKSKPKAVVAGTADPLSPTSPTAIGR